METETSATILLKTDHGTEDPALGFVEAFYQTCSATLVHLWKSRRQFILDPNGSQMNILKKDVADLKLWEESFPPGHLDTILAQSHHLKTSVIENLVGIGKVLKLCGSLRSESITLDAQRQSKAPTRPKSNLGREKDTQEVNDKTSIPSPMSPKGFTVGVQYERNVMKELLAQLDLALEKAANILAAEEDFGASSTDDESSIYSDSEFDSEDENEPNHFEKLHCYIECMIDLVPVFEKHISRMHSEREPLLISPDDFFNLPERAHSHARRIRDRFVNAPSFLVKRLAEANRERSIRIEAVGKDDEDDRCYNEALAIFKPYTRFPNAATDTSSYYSFLSITEDEGTGHARIPPLPRPYGQHFRCDYCAKVVSMQNRVEWKAHLFADLQSYICTHLNCKHALRTFSSRSLWAKHEFHEHFIQTQWRCFICDVVIMTRSGWICHLITSHEINLTGERLNTAISEAEETVLSEDFRNHKCAICLQSDWQSMNAYATHVGHHLEEISLGSLTKIPEIHTRENLKDGRSEGFYVNDKENTTNLRVEERQLSESETLGDSSYLDHLDDTCSLLYGLYDQWYS